MSYDSDFLCYISVDWLPTTANVNALPKPIRDYIHGLESLCDPAGLVRENAVLRHDNAEFEFILEGLRK